jgi:hypothetical protein
VKAAAIVSSISNALFTWDENGFCTSIEVGQLSFLGPMVPDALNASGSS